jgi:hypothetical protein
MASTYVNNLRLNEMATGDGSGTWGTTTNTNLELIGQALGYGTRAIANASTDNITIADGASDSDRAMYLKLTGGGQACTVTLLPNTASKVWMMENATSYTLTFTQGSGANVAILAGETKIIATDGGGSGGVVYDVLTDTNLAGTTKTAALTNAGALSNQGTLTVGVDDTGYDVKLFGATSGNYMLWDESADSLLVNGDIDMVTNGNRIDLDTDNDTSIRASADDTITIEVGGSDLIALTSTSTFSCPLTVGVNDTGHDVTFFGATSGQKVFWDESADTLYQTCTVDIDGTVTVGVDDTGYDVKFFGATASAYMLWDASADDLVLAGAAGIDLAGDLDVDGTTNLDAVDIDGNVQLDGTLTVGVDDTGLDVKFFGASAGAFMHWDESADLLDIRGATAAGPGLLKLTTGELTVVDGDKLGKIDFQAPLESDGTDAILVAASIYAEADDTFSASVNNTDLVFALGKSAAASEKFRFTADNEIGIAGANYGTDGQVLTSGGAGAAVAWEDAGGSGATDIDGLSDAKSGGTNFSNSLILGHQTTGTLSSADYNTAVGYGALDAVTSGNLNTCIGYNAGTDIAGGINNTLIGKGAGGDNASLEKCTLLGATLEASATNGDSQTIIGFNGVGKGDSTMFAAGASSGSYQQNNSASWSTTSDQRIKKNITNNNVGLNIIDQVQVRNFEYRTEAEITDFDNPKAVMVDRSGTQLGVIAQELEAICPACINTLSTGAKAVDTDELFWHMLNAIKELSAKVTALEG